MAKTTQQHDSALLDLIEVSKIVGSDNNLVQGGGGNTSVKTADGKYMFIKASGTALKDMDTSRGFRRMKIEPILAILDDQALASRDATSRELEVVNRLLTACDDDIKSGARPSVEAHLHALLDRYVIHLHPVLVGAFVNAKPGKSLIEKIFASEKLPPLWIPYVDPGLMLGLSVRRLVSAYQKKYGKKPEIIFLEKHGLLVTSDSKSAALDAVNRTIALLKKQVKQTLSFESMPAPDSATAASASLAIRQAVFKAFGEYRSVCYFNNKTISAFMARPDAKTMLSKGALTPDELVYANGAVMYIDKLDADKLAAQLKSQVDKKQKPSFAFLVKGVGLFVAKNPSEAPLVAEIATCSMFMRTAASDMGGIYALNQREVDFINNWESEAFRQKAFAAATCGDLKDRISVVTGAGSGLGRSIAVGLARAGAIVAIADIDANAAAETAAVIKAELPKAQTLVLKCNVTSEDDVVKGYNEIVSTFGGLDICVNAAGIAPAYSLIDMPVDKWRLALEINLTGYFLMAKHAARIMISQGMGGSIVCISSKSGLDASKNNTPYNATKAGEIHMARGWALELGHHGIRVNCVAPGNVFEGSKIWNPEYIKVCAKKYGIKPEEVIPYYVNKTALRREIKGQDIADSVVFLSSDRARTITGQVIVADSGQVMVR